MLNHLTTAHLSDACLRVLGTVRCAPHTLKPIATQMRCSGPAIPVQHFGSVDILFEAINSAAAGDVLVIDNTPFLFDEACVGDLVTLELTHAGLNGVIIWGLHRDTAELKAINTPVFSLGALPNGPLHTRPQTDDALTVAHVGNLPITKKDWVVADEDGVIFIPADQLNAVVDSATAIKHTEAQQADLAMHQGQTLRHQMAFAQYLTQKQHDPNYTFRTHLQTLQKAIEV